MHSYRLHLLLAIILCPLVKAAREVVIDAFDPQVTYSPSTGTRAWSRGSTTSDCPSPYMYSNSNDASATIRFTGVAVALRLSRFSSGARVQIELDGAFQTTVDTYLSSGDCATPVFVRSNLTDTAHTLRITDSTKNNVSRWVRLVSLTYTELTPEERGAYTSSVSVASVASVSIASTSSAAQAQASLRSQQQAKGGKVAGGVVGGVVGLLLVAGLVWFFLRRKRTTQTQNAGQPHFDSPAQSPIPKQQLPPSQYPTVPYYQPQTMAQSSPTPASFGSYTSGPTAYQQSLPTGTTTSVSPAFGSPVQPPAPIYGERPPSQYDPHNSQYMANMVANMVAERMQGQQGMGSPPPPLAPIPEPMEPVSAARNASAVRTSLPYLGTHLPPA